MAGIFICYRHDDSGGYAGRLYDELSDHFGSEQLFRDIDAIPSGEDFAETIEKAVGRCDVLLVMIGRRWLTITDDKGQRRLDDPEDFIRLEIAAALTRNIPVIPVLLQGATMPPAKELPKGLEKFDRRQAHEITDSRWKYDVGQLIERLKKEPGLARAARSRPRPEQQSAVRFNWRLLVIFAIVGVVGLIIFNVAGPERENPLGITLFMIGFWGAVLQVIWRVWKWVKQ